MPHANSPLTPEGKRRLIERLETGRPIAHVADEMGISRRTAAKWYTRYREHGWAGLEEMSSRPLTSPTSTPDNVVHLVLDIRRSSKWGAARIAAHMNTVLGVEISHSTVQRILHRRGLSRVSDMDEPTGELKRERGREAPARDTRRPTS